MWSFDSDPDLPKLTNSSNEVNPAGTVWKCYPLEMIGPSRSPRRFQASRSRGQSFLRDKGVVERIVEAIDPHPDETFLEIGAGAGELTLPLASRGAARVLAIETDRMLFEKLASMLQKDGKSPEVGEDVELIHADFLKLDLQKLLSERGIRRVRVVGNLPFSVASPILFKLLAHRERLVDLTLMFQLEVAQRLTAVPATKAYGFLTVVAQQAAKTELLFTIPPHAFKPRPKVHAAIVKFVPLGKDESPVGDYEVFRTVVRGLLTHRRKNISNNIKYLGSQLVSASSIHSGLSEMGIDPNRRAETLSVEEFAALSHFCASPQ